jgi:hypothetical protein
MKLVKVLVRSNVVKVGQTYLILGFSYKLIEFVIFKHLREKKNDRIWNCLDHP